MALKKALQAKYTPESFEKERYKYATTCSSYLSNMTENQCHWYSTKDGCFGDNAFDESVKSRAEESFKQSAISFRFLVFWGVGDW